MTELLKATGFGRCGSDAQMKYTPEGTALTTVNVACEQDGQTVWQTVAVWDDAAEEMAEKVHKGDWLAFAGSLKITHRDNGKTYRDVNAWLVWTADYFYEKPKREVA